MHPYGTMGRRSPLDSIPEDVIPGAQNRELVHVSVSSAVGFLFDHIFGFVFITCLFCSTGF